MFSTVPLNPICIPSGESFNTSRYLYLTGFTDGTYHIFLSLLITHEVLMCVRRFCIHLYVYKNKLLLSVELFHLLLASGNLPGRLAAAWMVMQIFSAKYKPTLAQCQSVGGKRIHEKETRLWPYDPSDSTLNG